MLCPVGVVEPLDMPHPRNSFVVPITNEELIIYQVLKYRIGLQHLIELVIDGVPKRTLSALLLFCECSCLPLLIGNGNIENSCAFIVPPAELVLQYGQVAL